MSGLLGEMTDMSETDYSPGIKETRNILSLHQVLLLQSQLDQHSNKFLLLSGHELPSHGKSRRTSVNREANRELQQVFMRVKESLQPLTATG